MEIYRMNGPERKTYTIMIQGYNGLGPGNDPHERKMTLTCTRHVLDTISEMWLLEYRSRYTFVCCIAAEGEYVDNTHWSIMYHDSM